MSSDVEAAIAEARGAGDHDRAATLLLRRYGPELLGFLRARLRDPVLADDAFASVSEKIWRGLEGFSGRSTARVWAYAIAVNEVRDQARRRGRERERRAASSDARLSQLVDEVRSETAPYRRTDVKDRMRALREELSDEDQELLVLRVDKQLRYDEIVDVLAEAPLDPAARKREAARLRKRFQLVRGALEDAARRAGLLDG